MDIKVGNSYEDGRGRVWTIDSPVKIFAPHSVVALGWAAHCWEGKRYVGRYFMADGRFWDDGKASHMDLVKKVKKS